MTGGGVIKHPSAIGSMIDLIGRRRGALRAIFRACNHTIVIVACRRRNRRCRAVLLFFERKGCELILYRYI